MSLPGLASHVRLDDLHASIGVFLDDLRAGGPIAKVAALAGTGAVLIGLLLAFGVLARRRERRVLIRSGDDGAIAARPRAVSQAAVTVAEQSRDVLHAKARTTARRRGTGGRLRLTVYRAQSKDMAGVTAASRDRVATDDLTLDISASRADELAATLHDVHQRARDSLARHELPPLPVNITLVRLERETRRELQ